MKNKFIRVVLYCVGITLSISFAAQSQTIPSAANKEMLFLNYLVSSQQNNEALFLIDKHLASELFRSNKDSLFFLKSKIFYNQNKLSESSLAINQISKKFTHYIPVKILESYEFAHLGYLKKSQLTLDSLSSSDNLINELIKFEKASVSVLNFNVANYQQYQKEQDTSFNQLIDAQIKLQYYATQIANHKSKSPVLAGIMSSIIPGSGKMYAGKIGEGVTSLLGMTILGAISYENYKKEGLKNYKTILFGSLFTVFYAGNIFGSVYAVKVYRDEFNKNINHAVLFNMHIPIRTIFPDIFE